MRNVIFLILPVLLPAQPGAPQEWRSWSGGNDGNRYSPLTQINRANVKQLKVAWEFKSGDADPRGRTAIQCTPIMVNGVLYATTPTLDAVALDAATGKLLWRFSPPASRFRGVSRGVMFWQDKSEARVFYAAGTQLLAIDAKTGQAIPSFGDNGAVNLAKDLDRDPPGAMNGSSSPGVIYKDLIIMGSSVGEGPRMAAPGHIRAYDVRTGQRRWIFHTIPHPGEFGHDTWPKDAWKTSGGTNAWGGISVDEKAGVVFVSLGSPSYDYYGADRIGDNLFGNSIVALDANTGKRLWHYQTVHHDIWDYDLPVNANLFTWKGKPALAQITKQGYVFVLDRKTGKPLLPVEERAFPASDIPGEVASRTQPVPLKPPPFSPQRYEPSDVTPETQAKFAEMSKNWINEGIYIPPGKRGTAVVPGTVGGGLWGGAAVDPAKGILYVNSQNLPTIMQIVDAPPGSPYPYQLGGIRKLRDEKGNPGIKPPWGQLTAIDLNKGVFLWQKVLGKNSTTEKEVGTENFGGPVLTAGGLVFIGATKDEMFRAFDAATGAILWEAKLPAGGYATPATYSLNGKQYVVIACGGGARLDTKSGDSYVAFALP